MKTIEQIQKDYKKKVKNEKNIKKHSESRKENLLKEKVNIPIPEVDKIIELEKKLKKIHNKENMIKKKTVHFQDNYVPEKNKNLKKVPTEAEIERAINLEKELQKTYRNETEKRLNNEIAKQKEFEPITTGLKNIEKAVRKTDDDITSFLVPVKSYTQTSDFIDKQNNLIKNRELNTQKSITNTPTRENEAQSDHTIILGDLSKKYLPRLNDKHFGIWYNSNTEKYMIGKNEININYNDIILNGKTYKGTPGLWRLLSYQESFDSKFYTPEDFVIYKNILLETDSIYHGNDKNTGRVKSSKGSKYLNMISPFWKEIQDRKKLEISENKKHEGSGLIDYTENPIQYKYINN